MLADPPYEETVQCQEIWTKFKADCDKEPKAYCERALEIYQSVLDDSYYLEPPPQDCFDAQVFSPFSSIDPAQKDLCLQTWEQYGRDCQKLEKGEFFQWYSSDVRYEFMYACQGAFFEMEQVIEDSKDAVKKNLIKDKNA